MGAADRQRCPAPPPPPSSRPRAGSPRPLPAAGAAGGGEAGPPGRGVGVGRQRPAFVCPGPGATERSEAGRPEPSRATHIVLVGDASLLHVQHLHLRDAPPGHASASAPRSPAPAAKRGAAAALGGGTGARSRDRSLQRRAEPSRAEPSRLPARCRGREAAPARPGLSRPEGRPHRRLLKGAIGAARPTRGRRLGGCAAPRCPCPSPGPRGRGEDGSAASEGRVFRRVRLAVRPSRGGGGL